MIRIKALNDSSSCSDSSDSEYQVTREAEEEELNQLYIKALKSASEGNTANAIRLLEELKLELEEEIPRVKDALLLKRLKYLAYKNLGLLKNDLNFVLDALEIDNSDINLWITAGKKGREKLDCLLSKYCFENAFKFNELNCIVIDNLIDLYFILNDLHKCINMCLYALNLDGEYLKGKIVLNECIRLMPPIRKDLDAYKCHIFTIYGGDECSSEDFDTYSKQILDELNSMKTKRLMSSADAEEITNNKRKRQTLNLADLKTVSFETIGIKIKSLYETIQKSGYNICSPIDVVFGQKEFNTIADEEMPAASSSNGVQTDTQDSVAGNESSQHEKDQDESSKSRSKEQRLREEKQALYDYIDKRRSSRVKSKSNKNRDLDDDQSIFETLMEILPESLKCEKNKLDYTDSSNSASQADASLKFESEVKINENEKVQIFLERLKYFQTSQHNNIFELISLYLVELSNLKNIKIPNVYLQLYSIYRENHELPCPLLCEIGKDISVDMVKVCLTANELCFKKIEAIFLQQTLNQMSCMLDTDEYRQFIIRLFVLCGSKELNNDYLYFALDLCSTSPKHSKYFDLDLPENTSDSNQSGDANQAEPYQVVASNKLLINTEYINMILDMQTVSITELAQEKNYAEIIKVLFTKSEKDLTREEKSQLQEAIVATEMWQKGVELLESWCQLDHACLPTILECVRNGTRARLSTAMVSKVAKLAVSDKSVLPWLILYWTFIAEGVSPSDPDSPLIKFFTIGHSYLGKKGICTEKEGEFLLLAQKVLVKHDVEEEALKCFSCLYNFPLRKQSSCSHHTSPHIELKWNFCEDIYDYLTPEKMPEFDNIKRDCGILQETKEFFLLILRLVPENEQPTQYSKTIIDYINNGKEIHFSEDVPRNLITSTIYYLLADYYFNKAKDFAKAKQFFIFDLCLNQDRLDSWASLALSFNHKFDELISDGNNTDWEKLNRAFFSAIQCYEKALHLQPSNTKLWIEFGLMCYNYSSNISRLTKRSKNFGLNESTCADGAMFKYEETLSRAKSCFLKVRNTEEECEELWLSFYMLGKVSEKNNDNLLATIELYHWADRCLYLDGAVYPRKISYYSPPTLAIEALEIHYRIHTCILKYLINNRKFSARMLRQLKLQLIQAKRSPFVTRKSYSYGPGPRKQNGPKNATDQPVLSEADQQISTMVSDVISIVAERDVKFDVNRSRNELIFMCIDGIKRCLSRYSAHYKSYYRLAYYYFNIGEYSTAKAVLYGGPQNRAFPSLQFEPEPGKPNASSGYVSGLFADRKPINLFNGIWRIPLDEIERVGNFGSHMFRCAHLLIRVCVNLDDYYTLSNIAIQLHKTPEQRDKFLNDTERIVLSKNAFDCCFHSLTKKLEKPETNKERLVEDIQNIAQNMIKSNVFAEDTISICNGFNARLQRITQGHLA